MCGILYSQDSNNFTDLSILKKRGPEGFFEFANHMGYFAHALLNTIGVRIEQPLVGKHGILLYNGSTYNSCNTNDSLWLINQLDENLNNTIEVLKKLDGEYALVYATETHIVFAVDYFDQRNLWFYHNQEHKHLTVSSLPDVVKQKHNACWRALGNKIYILDRHDFSIRIENNRVFDLKQTVNHFDLVFETFEQAVKLRYNPKLSINLMSSGWDSGVINCATKKIFNDVDCVGDPNKEDHDILKQRIKLHNGAVVANLQGHHKEKEIMFNNILPSNDIWDDPLVESMLSMIKNHISKKSKKVILTGNGGDEIYNDWQGQHNGFKWSRSNGSFPSSLELIWPWHKYSERLTLCNIRQDFLCGYFGLEIRNPLLDMNLVQSWLNTTCELKNKGYKLWMQLYMDQQKYPYTFVKHHWGYDVRKPDLWKNL